MKILPSHRLDGIELSIEFNSIQHFFQLNSILGFFFFGKARGEAGSERWEAKGEHAISPHLPLRYIVLLFFRAH